MTRQHNSNHVHSTLQRSFVLALLLAAALYSLAQLGAPGKIAYSAGTYNGTVYIDYDNDGTQDANEPGQSSINVSLFDQNGNRCTASSNSSGAWNIDSGSCGGSLGAGPYRLEFVIPSSLSYFNPGAVGTNNLSSVTFVPNGGATVNFGLLSPDEYAGAVNVPLVTPNNSNFGASVTKTNSTTNPAVLAWPYNATGTSGGDLNNPDPTLSISFDDMGATWGLGIQRSNLRAYFSAALIRHIDLGPAARPATGAGDETKTVDGVYMVDMSSTTGTLAGYFTLNGITPGGGGSAGTISLGTVTREIKTSAVSTSGTTGTNTDLNALSTTNPESFDRDAFPKVGTIGFGGAEVSSDDKYLWLVNLNQKSLIRLDITNYGALPTTGGAPSASLVAHYAISTSGLPSCGSGGAYRPWGLKLHRGRGYVGITCDVLNGLGTADAWVRSFSLSDPDAGFTTEVSFDLDRNTSGGTAGYSRETPNLDYGFNLTFENRWNNWVSDFENTTNFSYEDGTSEGGFESGRPQPLIGDIEFADNGDMIVGMMDRTGLQLGYDNYSRNPADDTSGTQDRYAGDSGGDLLHVCLNSGSYVVEGFTGCVIDNDTAPVAGDLANDGPNSVGEYYYDDWARFSDSVIHYEIATGGLTVRRSTNQVVSTVFDPLVADFNHGVKWYDTNRDPVNGGRGAAEEEYQAWPVLGSANHSKVNGLGDLEQLAVAPLELGNRVWRDDDGDGIQDPGEMGLAGVTVQLLRSGTVVGTAVTNLYGDYRFVTNTAGDSDTSDNIGYVDDSNTGVRSSTAYVIRVNPSAGSNTNLLNGLALGTQNATDSGAADSGANADARDSDASTVSGNYEISYTTGTAGVNNHTLDFSFAPRGSIGNRVWLDEDSNGYQDEGEVGIANVRVWLDTDNDGVVDAAEPQRYTDSSGDYLFAGLTAGTYQVRVDTSTLASGLSQTNIYPNAGADLYNQQLTAGNGYQVTLSAGQDNLTADFGYNWNPTANVNSGTQNATATLGDRVWIDTDADGVQDAGEIGVYNVTVSLYKDTENDGDLDDDNNGAIDAENLVTTTTTDYNGYYIFDGLTPGAYTVQVTNSGSASHNILDTGQYTQTGDPDYWGATIPAPTSNRDNRTTTAIVLGPGDVFLDADFGYDNTVALGTIGDFVWFDRDAGGDQDGGEPGIAGVTVALIRDLDGDGTWDSGEPIISTTTTNASGAYLFNGLYLNDGGGDSDADYLVWVNDTNHVLDGLRATADADGSGAPASGLFTGLGISATFLNAGNTSRTNQDFGYTPDNSGQQSSRTTLSLDANTGMIGDRVWLDISNPDVQDPGEPGIQGVRVNLYDSTGTSLLATTTTGPDGYYLFPNLIAATYIIRVDTTTLPVGLTQTYDATNPQTDSQSTEALAANEVNLTHDFGYVGTGSIGNLVWNDTDADGVKDASESGINGVTLDLYYDKNENGKIDPGEPKLGTTTTSGGGAYTFSGLPTDDGGGNAQYVVDVTDTAGVLNGYWHSSGTAGSNDNSQADPYAVTLTTGSTTNNTADFGYYVKPASVGNFVWYDADADGAQDVGETGINGVVMRLTITYPGPNNAIGGGDDTVSTIYTTTGDDPSTTGTTESGWYSFANLLQDEDYNGANSAGLGEPTFAISVVTADGTGALTDYAATAIDLGGDDKLDSDDPAGVTATAIEGSTTVTQQSPASGEGTLASYDFGYTKLDYGDAPDTGSGTAQGNYRTKYSDNGPRHFINNGANGIRLGATIDPDNGTLQNATATQDDNTNTGSSNDEDSITTFPAVGAGTTSYSLDISVFNNTGANATLYAWIDWNRNGVFDTTELGATTAVTSQNTQQTKTVTWNGLSGIVSGVDYFVRVRLTTGIITGGSGGGTADTNSTGVAPNGEVQDFRISATPTAATVGELRAQNTTEGAVLLQWESLNELKLIGFNVERKLGKQGEYAPINTELMPAQNGGDVSGRTYEYTDSSVESGKTYFYRIEFVSTDGASERTKAARIQVKPSAACQGRPDASTLLTPADGDKARVGQVKFSWNPVNCAAYYVVEIRHDSPEGQVALTSKQLKKPQFSTKKLEPRKIYSWRVSACTANGKCKNSDWWSFRVIKQEK